MIKRQRIRTRRMQTTITRINMNQYWFIILILIHYCSNNNTLRISNNNIFCGAAVAASSSSKGKSITNNKQESIPIKQPHATTTTNNRRQQQQKHYGGKNKQEKKTSEKEDTVIITTPTKTTKTRVKKDDIPNRKENLDKNHEKSCVDDDDVAVVDIVKDQKEEELDAMITTKNNSNNEEEDAMHAPSNQAHLLRQQQEPQHLDLEEIGASKKPKTTHLDQIIKEEKQKQSSDFLDWSFQKLGIQTSSVTIRYFDYTTAVGTQNQSSSSSSTGKDDSLNNATFIRENQEDIVQIAKEEQPIRGLAATRLISSGEKILSIPFQSTITKSTIHKDPVLSIILKEYSSKWNQQPTYEADQPQRSKDGDADDDIQLNSDDNRYKDLYQLIIYLLYQRSLGRASAIKPYIDILLTTPYEDIPFLWPIDKLHTHYPDENHIVRVTSQEILNDIQEMYEDHIPVFMELYPEIFGRRGEEDTWMFSLEHFKWAYAMTHSRHWHLPCSDLDDLLHNLPSNDNDYTGEQRTQNGIMQHILMVPVADLINFGPACTKALYNATTHAFEIIATCDIPPGDEITFWYTNDCQDIVYANFGFTHALIPPCPTLSEYKERNSRLMTRLKLVQEELMNSWENVEQLQLVIRQMQHLLDQCGCDTTAQEANDNMNIHTNDIYSDDYGPSIMSQSATSATSKQQEDSQKLRGEKEIVRVRGKTISSRSASDIMDDTSL